MADLSQNITAKVSGAYRTLVKLSDGSIMDLADYWTNPAGRTIEVQLAGAYGSMGSKADLSITSMAADISATGGKDVINELPGAYNERVVVDGEIVSQVDKISFDANAAP